MDAINPNTKRSYRHRRKWGAGGKKAFEGGDRSSGQEAFIDLFNRLAAQYGAPVTDFMVEEGVTPFAFFRLATLIQDDLDLWFEATGQRVSQLIGAERQALECWLWETHDRQRQLDRSKPNKSPDHDAPWPGATNWHPRRWFADVAPSWEAPLTISVSKAVQEEVLKALTDDFEDRLNTEIDRRRNDRPEAPPPERPPPGLDPSAWAFHVEISANAFSRKRKECERRREAAICGLLSNFGCV